jgi:hypothetical protein
MKTKITFYQVESAHMRDAVWIHASDGSTVGRFGKLGVDLHNTATEQLNGMPQCRLCTHGKVNRSDWDLFREKALEWWGVVVPVDAFDFDLFQEKAGAFNLKEDL